MLFLRSECFLATHCSRLGNVKFFTAFTPCMYLLLWRTSIAIVVVVIRERQGKNPNRTRYTQYVTCYVFAGNGGEEVVEMCMQGRLRRFNRKQTFCRLHTTWPPEGSCAGPRICHDLVWQTLRFQLFAPHMRAVKHRQPCPQGTQRALYVTGNTATRRGSFPREYDIKR